jgi:hypothetical protein
MDSSADLCTASPLVPAVFTYEGILFLAGRCWKGLPNGVRLRGELSLVLLLFSLI